MKAASPLWETAATAIQRSRISEAKFINSLTFEISGDAAQRQRPLH